MRRAASRPCHVARRNHGDRHELAWFAAMQMIRVPQFQEFLRRETEGMAKGEIQRDLSFAQSTTTRHVAAIALCSLAILST